MPNRIKTYIEGLDAHMEGGIPENHVTLVCGVAGTMKSSLCFNIIYNEALVGKNSVYLTLEQSAVSLVEQIENLQYDLKKINLVTVTNLPGLDRQLSQHKDKNAKGTVFIIDIGVIRKLVKGAVMSPNANWLNVIKNIIKKLKTINCSLFVLDSLSALYLLTKFGHPRTELFYFFEFLRNLEITSFLISEMPLSRDRYGEYQVEDFLADGVIKLDLVERQRKVTREITIVKMRGTKMSLDVFTLQYEKKKFSALYGGQPPLI